MTDNFEELRKKALEDLERQKAEGKNVDRQIELIKSHKRPGDMGPKTTEILLHA